MNTGTRATADQLHTGLIDLLVARGTVTSPQVEAALRAVPRHSFVPDSPLETAYAPDDAVVTKRDADGVALSSASAPGVVAAMLEQLDVRPGMRILEIGAGTGYNAALLATLTGPTGHVVTVDIDADVVAGARDALAATGFTHVETLTADGAQGHAPGAPYDRIIVTAGAWDLPPAWWQQLAPAGRLVVPLRITGGTSRAIAFDRENDHLTSRSMITCGFLAMRGIDARDEPVLTLATGVNLLLNEGGTAAAEPMSDALTQPSTRTRSGVTVRSGQPFQDLDLWLATTSPGFCRIIAAPDAVTSDLVTPAFRWGGAALTNSTDSFAYLTIRPAEPENANTSDGRPTFELGVRAHGPDSDALTQVLLDQIRRWDDEHRDSIPRIDAHLKPAQPVAGTIIDKPHSVLAVTW
ncbi:methyltransferase, FxLD system [Actinocorallia sp. A-T 12471]|uniref:methyltransferase, FxLD system n=1 Tax=Actinocorallia sp. A-T 12471 TaxID=3089813 RepID=UPI0029CCC4D2|nr:methyltransferase, FxLD system [Actinocorallia sp. A-T 12471]MDX6743616.1 methyltransferase, FxLD system [Actinocorallia sp. A-T 12471]